MLFRDILHEKGTGMLNLNDEHGFALLGTCYSGYYVDYITTESVST
jgi:hypothetical protein